MITAPDLDLLREAMVARQLRARGITSPLVLDAMRRVRREGYVPSYLGEFAYEDSPLPIEEEQTISQPYIVGFMIEALHLEGGERVLEVGTGSGYAAAVLAEIAGEVYTIERHERLANLARERLGRDGYANVHVRHGDGTLGWPEHAPFDAIVVAAGGPRVPDALEQQLAIGGRLVIPVGDAAGQQQLVRVTRTGAEQFRRERLANVRFVPLVGEQGWRAPAVKPAPAPRRTHLTGAIAHSAEPFADTESVDWRALRERIGNARVVLLGESTHGTAEFYRFRARLTRDLVEKAGFTIVAAEADWPDAARIDHYVRDREVPRSEWQAFARFPTWMWRNREFAAFVDWLRTHNLGRSPDRRVRFAGLDLYAMHNSIDVVLRYLDSVDPEAAAVARHRYGCLTPWQSDPAAYGRAVLTGSYRSCEHEVVRTLEQLLQERLAHDRLADEHLFEAIQNARTVADAERYYRAMYYGSHESWNLRDRHMCDCLRQLLAFHDSDAKIVVWAHNSHVGDARATEMSARNEWNLGQLCRQELSDDGVYLIGFGTDHGTVAAASYWGGEVEFKQVRPALPASYERACHDSGVPSFVLPLQRPRDPDLRTMLAAPRLQRAIGVIYRPETERASHYYHAELPGQFDEFVWFDATTAVSPLTTTDLEDVPDTYPFGL
ncbi:MAG TPA: protein-L-isoaspartate(D-aspartate) O-methyltransferase [Planctomycetota bacterium]|nr:protein-L-isoaspartate(D-aspartate) O-methyltransferase [Planctomycetota bacterium]